MNRLLDPTTRSIIANAAAIADAERRSEASA